MSTTIKFEHEAQVKEETYKVGDWFMFRGELFHLSAMPADGNKPQALLIKATTGVRSDQLSPSSLRHDDYSASDITSGFKSDEWQRVSVEITTKPFKG